MKWRDSMKLTKKNGEYKVSKPDLSIANELFLENGGSLEVVLTLKDDRRISPQQRKFIFAICRLVEYETGIDKEMFRGQIMEIHDSVYGTKIDSLSDYNMTQATNLIKLLITFLIDKEIDFGSLDIKGQEYHFDASQTYLMCLKRVCVVCGRRAELHHVDAVGMSRNRNKISHIGMRMLPLCRIHHSEAHAFGDTEFMEYYHLTPIEIDKKLEHFIKTGIIKVYEERDDD